MAIILEKKGETPRTISDHIDYSHAYGVHHGDANPESSESGNEGKQAEEEEERKTDKKNLSTACPPKAPSSIYFFISEKARRKREI